jgi:hypothetical protein
VGCILTRSEQPKDNFGLSDLWHLSFMIVAVSLGLYRGKHFALFDSVGWILM